MFTLTLTRVERGEISDIVALEGAFPSLFATIALSTEYAPHYFQGSWYSSVEPMVFVIRPEEALQFLPFLTADALKEYSPDLANKLAGLREWINSLGHSGGG